MRGQHGGLTVRRSALVVLGGPSMVGGVQVTLLGHNINAWGRDLSPKQKSSGLLAVAVGSVPGIERVRFLQR